MAAVKQLWDEHPAFGANYGIFTPLVSRRKLTVDLTMDPRGEANIDQHPWYKALRDQTWAVVPKKEWYSFFSSHGSKPSLG